MNNRITEASVAAFAAHLRREERSESTVEKYCRALASLRRELPRQGALDRPALLAWKRGVAQRYSPATVNTMIAAVNSYCEYIGRQDCCLSSLRVQRRIFREQSRELTRGEYLRLLEAAQRQGNDRLRLIMETLGSTGIRISELRFVTAEAVRRGRATVDCKGKRREIMLPKTLRRMLESWLRRSGVTSGPVFVSAAGKPLDRSNIWRELKRLCSAARVDSRKVFPHNFRHLFAVIYYKMYKDMSKLADLLGHSSINTTKIYLMESGRTHERQLERLGMVL